MDLKTKVVDDASDKGTLLHVPAEHLKSSEPGITAHPLASMLSARYDVILLAPPLNSATWNWGMTEDLPIRGLSADPSFVFLWVGPGNGGGLENGRECLAKWGFRRCEDLIFIKKNRAMGDAMDATSSDTGLLSSQKEHCLMGIRGTVRRATDSWFVHCNVDVDTFLWDNSLGGSTSGTISDVQNATAPQSRPTFTQSLKTSALEPDGSKSLRKDRSLAEAGRT